LNHFIKFSREDRIAFFLFFLLVDFSRSNFLLGSLISSKKSAKDIFQETSFGFKLSWFFFLLFELGNCSAIRHFVVVVVTIVTTHFERSFRRHAANTGIGILIFYCYCGRAVDMPDLLSNFTYRLR
jgi:hypothetical protein